MEYEKVLLNVEDTSRYLNLGKTKTREIMKENENTFHIFEKCTFEEYREWMLSY